MLNIDQSYPIIIHNSIKITHIYAVFKLNLLAGFKLLVLRLLQMYFKRSPKAIEVRGRFVDLQPVLKIK